MKCLPVILISLFFLGCSYFSKPQNTSTDASLSDSVGVADIASHVLASDMSKRPVNVDSLKMYLRVADDEKAALTAKLKAMTTEQVDDYYDSRDYRFDKSQDFKKMENLLFPAFERYSDHDSPMQVQDDKVFALLKTHGFDTEILEGGEVLLSMDYFYYYEIFKNYTGEETREYAEIYANQDGHISFDAGLVLTPEELYTRSIMWEAFLAKYPKGRYSKNAIHRYGEYMGLLMFCTYDNTRVFWDGKVETDYIDRIKKLLGKNANSQTETILTEYCKEVEKANYRYSEKLENRIMTMGILKDLDCKNTYY